MEKEKKGSGPDNGSDLFFCVVKFIAHVVRSDRICGSMLMAFVRRMHFAERLYPHLFLTKVSGGGGSI